MNPRVLVVQHSATDSPGRLGPWLVAAGCRLELVRCHLGESLPTSLEPYDALVVLGGEMGAYDDAVVPWLSATKELLRAAVVRDLPTLGVCLGHQLLAVANGGQVVRATIPQRGLTAVDVTAEGAADPLFEPLVGRRAVHWNNDIVRAAPPGAVILAGTPSQIQAFRLGNSVYGIQFHPEVEIDTVTEWAGADVAVGTLTAAAARDKLAAIDEVDGESATWRGFTEGFRRQLPQRGDVS